MRRECACRPIDIGEAERGGIDAVNIAVETAQLLHGDLGDRIHVGWVRRVLLIDREIRRSPIDLSRAREHHPRVGCVVPYCLEQGNRADHVHVHVVAGVRHRAGMARLAGTVENGVDTAYQRFQDRAIADIAADDGDVALGAFEIARVCATARKPVVQHAHLGPFARQPPHERGADETAPAGHEDAPQHAPGARGLSHR